MGSARVPVEASTDEVVVSGIRPSSAESIEDLKSKDDIKKSKFTLHQKIALVTLCTADFMCYCSMSIMAPFYPKKASSVGMSETVAGFVFSFYALVIFLSSPLFGKIIPKIGVKACFSVGLLVAGACNVAFGTLNYVDNYIVFATLSFVIRGTEALGSGAFSTASYVLVTSIFPDHAGFVRGLLEVFVGLGLSAGPALGGFLFALGGFHLPFYVIGTLIIFLMPFTKCLINDNVSAGEEKPGSLKALLCLPTVIMTSVIVIVISITWSFLDPTLEPHLRKYDLNAAHVGLIFLLLSATYGIFSPIAGWLSDKLDQTYWLLMVAGMFLSAVALLFLGPSPLLSFLNESLWWDVGSLSFLGVFVAIALLPTYRSVLDAALENNFEDNVGTQGLVAGIWSSLYSLGEVIGPISGGSLFNQWGFPVTVSVVALLNVVTAIMAFIYFSYTRKKNKKTEKQTNLGKEKPKENGVIIENDIKVVTLSGIVVQESPVCNNIGTIS